MDSGAKVDFIPPPSRWPNPYRCKKYLGFSSNPNRFTVHRWVRRIGRVSAAGGGGRDSRGNLWEPKSTMQLLAGAIREAGMSPGELNRRAREVVDAIDAETGVRTAHAARVEHLYQLGRDIQIAQQFRAKVVTVHRIVAFLMEVLARSYGIGAFAR